MPFCVSGEMVFEETDSFSVVFHTSLTGTSGDYNGYTEEEHEERTYEVSSISGDQVTWIMDRRYSYTDTDGNSFDQEGSYRFSLNSVTRQYINSTYDAPSSYLDYYTFDYIWFRIDPDTPIDSQVTILGNEYTVIGLTTIFVDLISAVDVIELRATNVQQYILNDEYDPDGMLSITFTDSYYFDPTTGYFVHEVWSARGTTSVGNFDWYETGYLTESSYVLQQNAGQSLFRMLLFIGAILGVGLIFAAANDALKRGYQKSVMQAIRIMAGEIKPPMIEGQKVAPMLWNPLTISYQNLIERSPDVQYTTLQSGVYIAINPDNTIAIVDTQTNPRFKNLVFDFEETSLELLYKLALGTINPDTVEYQEVITRIQDVKDYLQSSDAVAPPDGHSLFIFNQIDSNRLQTILLEY
ncbi:MAG: hypothetical protein ACFFED_12670, partial [Candidatus Thorarchaeota archaeon]